MQTRKVAVLSITVSDATGYSGMQTDVKTISEMGGHALSVVSAVSMLNQHGKQQVVDLPLETVVQQVRSGMSFDAPRAVKVGMVHDAQTIYALGKLQDEFSSRAFDEQSVSAPRETPIVCAPGVLSFEGSRLVDDDALEAIRIALVPRSFLLVLRCNEAELLLKRQITSDEEMVMSANALHKMGARWVMLRGGLQTQGRCTALLSGPNYQKFFASYNVDGWRQHGVGGTLTAAITTRIAFGDDVPTAVSKAHDYVRSQVVYAINPDARNWRPSDLYNRFLSLVVQHYREAHDVAFYADKLSISTRYLSQLTNRYVDKSPKMVIADYVVQEARILLDTTRLSVQEVSYRLGFPDQAAFSKFFKQYSGQTPSSLRSC